MAAPSFRTSEERGRMHGILAAFALGGLLLVARLAQIQVLDHERLLDMARDMQSRRVEIEPTRGRIFDRNGELLAFSTENVSLYARREHIQSMTAARTTLDSLGVPRSRIDTLCEKDSGFVWLSRGLHSEEALRSVARRVPGLYVVREHKRVNPRADVALPVLGRWREEANQLSGLERRYDDLLVGEYGWETVHVDALGDRYATSVRREPRAGADIVLTIDSSIQEILEHELRQAVDRWSAKWATAIVVDPQTGDLIGMAGIEGDGNSLRNRAIQDALEVGSCAKVFVAAAALEHGIADTSTAFRCRKDPDEENAPRVSDDHGDEDWLSLQMIIAKSRNIGTARIAGLVGERRLHDMLTAMGFGQATGIELPAESAGQFRDLEEWSGYSLESVAIGYELACTPLQLCMAYAAVANGGWLLKPRLVRRIRTPDGQGRDISERIVVRRVLSERTSRTLSHVLNRVTRPGGTGENAALDFAPVSGKTGTAQKYDAELKRHTRKRHMSSFVGFAPTENARFVCAVMINEPEGAYYGSQVAAPVFRNIMTRIAARYPQRLRSDVQITDVPQTASRFEPGTALAAPASSASPSDAVPDLRGLSTLEARRRALRAGLHVELLGRGARVLSQSPLPGSGMSGQPMVLDTARDALDSVAVPVVVGFGVRRTLKTLAGAGLSFERIGVGRAVAQFPEPGAIVEPGTTVQVEFEPVARTLAGGPS